MQQSKDSFSRNPSWKLVYIFLIAGLGLAFIAAVSIGPVWVPPSELADAVLGRLSGRDSLSYTIIFQIRMPRVILSGLVGAGLATSGVILQGLLKNPMAEPYVLGISSGAALGATLAILFGVGTGFFGFKAVPVVAIIFGIGTTFLVYNLSRVSGQVAITTLLLAGIAVGSFFTALTSLSMVVGGQELHRVIFWLMGGFSGTTWEDIKMVVPYLIIGAFPVYFFARDLNLMLLGEESARHLGVDTEKVKFILLAASSLITAAAVSVSGLIGFVGLIIPHSVRLLVGPDHRVLLPAASLVGAVFLILADTLARTLGGAMEVPVGVITAMCGAPFFLYLLRREKNAGF